jgi:hypothetical protein
MRRSCSDSLLTASQSDGVFGSDSPGNGVSDRTAWWAWEDSKLQPNGHEPPARIAVARISVAQRASTRVNNRVVAHAP